MSAAKQLRDEGAVLFQKSEWANALAKFSGALAMINSLSPAESKEAAATHLSCLLNSASCCVKLSKWHDAIEYANAALALDKQNAKALFRRGQARRHLKEYAKARIDLVMAMELKDDEFIREELRLLREEQGAGGGSGVSNYSEHPPAGSDSAAMMAALMAANSDAFSQGPRSKPPSTATFDESTLTGAAKELYGRATGGDAAACIEVALAFEEGKSGFPQSPVQAFQFYSKAAELGSAEGQNCTGWCFKTGFGTHKSDTAAFEMYEKCASQGHVKGQANLAFCLEKGEGAAQDLVKAAEWYGKAAEGGSSVAQVNLALMYEKGRGVREDKAKALELYRLAGAQGNPNANINVGLYYEKGYVVQKDMKEAFGYYMKAAETGDHTGQTIVGCCFENGEGVSKDTQMALEYYMKAARQGNGHAREGLKRITGAA